MKIYCDANIFIDYFDEREDNIRPLKDFAFLFFQKGIGCRFDIVVSDWLLHELKKHLKESQINDIFNRFKEKGKLFFVEQKKEDWESAKKHSHPDDYLHAILAKRANADYLTTRNIRDYEDCDLLTIVLPEFI